MKDANLTAPSYSDALRYKYLRLLAMEGRLEAFVALGQLDHMMGDPERFDKVIDKAIKETQDE